VVISASALISTVELSGGLVISNLERNSHVVFRLDVPASDLAERSQGRQCAILGIPTAMTSLWIRSR
jgi:hypothetical protein